MMAVGDVTGPRKMTAEQLIRECRYRYKTTPSVPVLQLCDEAEALLAALRSVEQERDALKESNEALLQHRATIQGVVRRAEAAESALQPACPKCGAAMDEPRRWSTGVCPTHGVQPDIGGEWGDRARAAVQPPAEETKP